MFIGPVLRSEFIVDPDWDGAIRAAFSFSTDKPYVIGDVTAVLVAAAGVPGEKDWMAVVRIEAMWWFIIAGYPEESSWVEGIGQAIELSTNMKLAVNSKQLPGEFWYRCLPQLLRLYLDGKVLIINKPFLNLSAVKNAIPGDADSIKVAVIEARKSMRT